jgi:hypothetical protein
MRLGDGDPWAEWTALGALGVVVVNSYLELDSYSVSPLLT